MKVSFVAFALFFSFQVANADCVNLSGRYQMPESDAKACIYDLNIAATSKLDGIVFTKSYYESLSPRWGQLFEITQTGCKELIVKEVGGTDPRELKIDLTHSSWGIHEASSWSTSSKELTSHMRYWGWINLVKKLTIKAKTKFSLTSEGNLRYEFSGSHSMPEEYGISLKAKGVCVIPRG